MAQLYHLDGRPQAWPELHDRLARWERAHRPRPTLSARPEPLSVWHRCRTCRGLFIVHRGPGIYCSVACLNGRGRAR